MTEVWKDVYLFPNSYEVSNLGNVRNKRTGKILTPYISETGYLKVKLCENNIRKNERVHRLVALAFLDNPSKYPEVNHKDGNKSNNTIGNLEWCNRQYNQHDWMKRNNFTPKGRPPKKVKCGGLLFDSVQKCADYYGVSRFTMSKWLNGHLEKPQYFKNESLSFSYGEDN